MTEELHYRRAVDQHCPPWNEQVIDQQLDALFQDLELRLNQAIDGSAQPGSSALQPQAPATLTAPGEYPCPLPASPSEIEEALQRLYGPMEAQLEPAPADCRPIEWFSPLLPADRPPLVNDRLLFGMACASWMITLLLWLGSQFQGAPTPRLAAGPEQPPVPVQFPSPSAPGPPAPPHRLSPPVSPPVVRVPPPPPIQPPPIPRSQPVPQQTPAPVQSSQPAPAETVAPPAAVVKDRPAAIAAPTAPPVPAPAATPSVDRRLQGLMALGDRSVALLEIDGVPRQIKVGETIDASGWQLLAVAKDHAVLQRQGEQRSVYVGQSF